MHDLVLAQKEDYPEVVVHLPIHHLLILQSHYLLNHEIEKKRDVPLEKEVAVVHHHRISLLLLILVIRHNYIAIRFCVVLTQMLSGVPFHLIGFVHILACHIPLHFNSIRQVP
jgi:hypothetical protein